MMKSEFIELIGKDIKESDYEKVELVYMYYPKIETKKDIADIYLKYGMALIDDMVMRASAIRDVEQQIEKNQNEFKALNDKLKSYKE